MSQANWSSVTLTGRNSCVLSSHRNQTTWAATRCFLSSGSDPVRWNELSEDIVSLPQLAVLTSGGCSAAKRWWRHQRKTPCEVHTELRGKQRRLSHRWNEATEEYWKTWISMWKDTHTQWAARKLTTKGIPFFVHVLCIWGPRGSKRLPRWFGTLIYRHNSGFANFLKLIPECPVECGGRRGPIAIWAMLKCREHERKRVFPNIPL